jgi:hypothetical protein
MGKYGAESNTDQLVVKPPAKCWKCGWCFDVDNHKHHIYDVSRPERTRTEPRTQINISANPTQHWGRADYSGGYVVWCDPCYTQHRSQLEVTHSQMTRP